MVSGRCPGCRPSGHGTPRPCRARLAGQAEHPLADDVALDLVGAAADGDEVARQADLVDPSAERCVVAPEGGVGADRGGTASRGCVWSSCEAASLPIETSGRAARPARWRPWPAGRCSGRSRSGCRRGRLLAGHRIVRRRRSARARPATGRLRPSASARRDAPRRAPAARPVPRGRSLGWRHWTPSCRRSRHRASSARWPAWSAHPTSPRPARRAGSRPAPGRRRGTPR